MKSSLRQRLCLWSLFIVSCVAIGTAHAISQQTQDWGTSLEVTWANRTSQWAPPAVPLADADVVQAKAYILLVRVHCQNTVKYHAAVLQKFLNDYHDLADWLTDQGLFPDMQIENQLDSYATNIALIDQQSLILQGALDTAQPLLDTGDPLDLAEAKLHLEYGIALAAPVIEQNADGTYANPPMSDLWEDMKILTDDISAHRQQALSEGLGDYHEALQQAILLAGGQI